MDIAIVGRGRVGTAFTTLLERAGHGIVAEPSDAEIVVIATPDGAIAAVCSDLAERSAFRPGQLVAHVSGAAGLDVLAPAKALGALVASLHPLQTFPDAESAVDRVPGSGLAVTAEPEE